VSGADRQTVEALDRFADDLLYPRGARDLHAGGGKPGLPRAAMIAAGLWS
jgi:hypothetical protein